MHSSSDPKLKDIVSPVADAYNLLAAGMDTTSYNLSCATFFLLDSPHCLSRLQNELAQAGITSLDSMDLKKIQNLPYLVGHLQLRNAGCRFTNCDTLQTAVIKESLRLSTGQPGFLPRVVPSEGAHIGSTFIPGGVCTPHPRFLRILLIMSLGQNYYYQSSRSARSENLPRATCIST